MQIIENIKLKIMPSGKKEWKHMLVVLSIYTIWWMAVIICVVSLQGFDAIVKQYGSVSQAYGNIIHTIIKGAIAYYILIYRLALPLVRTKKRIRIFFQYFLFLLFATIYEYIWNFKIGSPSPSLKHFSLGFFFIGDLLLNILMAVIAIFIATWIESNEALKREGELEKQKLNAELSAIKYQINPHFLFNSLSFIYTKTVRQNPEAAHAVHLLSEIMSYALDEWEELGRVPLALEISHMKKVIEMNQIRFNNKLNVEFYEYIERNDGTGLNNAYVPALVFITLVENAFKHGELNDEKNKVGIKLHVTRGNISFSVNNKKKVGQKEPSKGIGLNNVRQRLQLMYGAEQSFIIKESELYYLTEININLKNHA